MFKNNATNYAARFLVFMLFFWFKPCVITYGQTYGHSILLKFKTLVWTSKHLNVWMYIMIDHDGDHPQYPSTSTKPSTLENHLH